MSGSCLDLTRPGFMGRAKLEQTVHAPRGTCQCEHMTIPGIQ